MKTIILKNNTRKKMIQKLVILAILFIGIKGHSQSYTLSDTLFEDSLYVNGNYDHSMYLQNNTNNKLVMVWNVVENTLDTNNWTILFCFYPKCLSNIPQGGTCDTIKPNEKVYMTGLSVSPALIPKDCNLKIEYYDISNPTARDTVDFILHASSTDKNPPEDTTSINDLQNESQIRIYPNPISNQFNIELKGIDYSWKLMDTYGRMVNESTISESQESVEIDSSSLPSGMYILEVYTAGGASYKKRIIKP